MEDLYAVIDLKSFYASCECAARGLDIFNTPLVVADISRTENTIIMSATPYLKNTYGIPNVCRVKDLPYVENMIYACPRMAYYVAMSAKVVSIFLDFVDEEDLHVYSIDESFLHLSPYLEMYGCDGFTLVDRIQKRIKKELGLIATAGLGPNMFLAKTCLDNEGKKKPPYRAYWGKEDVQAKLWSISPITSVWGIARGISTRLAKLGIRSMKGLATTDIQTLENEFGVIGDQLHELANGIDHSDIRKKYVPKERHLNQGQVLTHDYTLEGAKLILREMNDDLCQRLRRTKSKVGCVSCFVGYSAKANREGFSRQCSLNIPTDDVDSLYQAILHIFETFAVDLPIRDLGIAFSRLTKDNGVQYSLFDNNQDYEERRKLNEAIDSLQYRFGRNAVLRASSLLPDSTIRERHQQIGGHKA